MASGTDTTISSVAGVSIVDLARHFGTPCYVYDADLVRRRVADLATFDVVRYALKACSNLAVADLVRQCGAVVDTVSAGEIARALAAGFVPAGDPPGIVYTADIFDQAALDLVVEHSIHVNCGSPEMIDQLAARVPGQSVTLRINPGFGHGHSRKTNTGGEQSKHGIWHDQLAACRRRAERHGMAITGLHMHIGSGTDMEHLSQVSGAMQRLAPELGGSVRSISAGGGLPVPYRSGESYVDLATYFQIWDRTRQKLAAALGHEIRLEIEPGRYIVAESGSLVAEIRAVKSMGNNTYYLLDAGFNNLARPVLYGAYHPMAIAHRSGAAAGGPLQDVIVGGPLCESGDVFTQEAGGVVAARRLPPATVGDFLVIGCAGAYGAVMGSNYCSKPQCAEVLVAEGKPHLIRRRQSAEDLFRDERIPVTVHGKKWEENEKNHESHE